MLYEVHPADQYPGDWYVGAVDHNSEGECYDTLFSGSNAEARAREYAAWKNEYTPASIGGINVEMGSRPPTNGVSVAIAITDGQTTHAMNAVLGRQHIITTRGHRFSYRTGRQVQTYGHQSDWRLTDASLVMIRQMIEGGEA